ncbi:MAG: 50S ribosomal protein L25 [Deltaproteobacteria bacterium]|nr:50S ribosomal protein L25 [Deltaproteobacteria bacterium]MBW2370989.1 50S ribosomal protein L25 [Deltaproteobacteria bacterium]
MAENVLKVEVREGTGKGVARKLRAAGRIPGILYGRAKESVPLTLDPLALERAIQKSEAGVNTLFDLDMEGAKAGPRVVLVKDLQREPGAGFLLHADLYEVDLTQTVEVEIPIHLIGTPTGVSLEGGIMDHAHRDLRIECLPRAIPDELTLDVSALAIGDSLHVSDIALPEGVELRDDPDISVVIVAAPRKEEEELPAEAAEGEEGAVAEGEEPTEGAEKPAEGEDSSKEGGE